MKRYWKGNLLFDMWKCRRAPYPYRRMTLPIQLLMRNPVLARYAVLAWRVVVDPIPAQEEPPV